MKQCKPQILVPQILHVHMRYILNEENAPRQHLILPSFSEYRECYYVTANSHLYKEKCSTSIVDLSPSLRRRSWPSSSSGPASRLLHQHPRLLHLPQPLLLTKIYTAPSPKPCWPLVKAERAAGLILQWTRLFACCRRYGHEFQRLRWRRCKANHQRLATMNICFGRRLRHLLGPT